MKSMIAMTGMMIDIAAPQITSQLSEALNKARRILVVTHVNPDGDAIGSQLALGAYLTDIGKTPILLRESEIPSMYAFLADADSIQQIDSVSTSFEVDTVVALECPNRDRMGRVADLLRGGQRVISIDHHLDSEEYGDLNWIDPEFSSVGEMLWLFFRSVGYRMSTAMADHLYVAVMTDTGRFRFDSTTPRTMYCAGELIAAGANPARLSTLVYHNAEPATMLLLGQVLSGMEFFAEGRICALTLTRQTFSETGVDNSATEGLIDYTMFSKGVEIGVLFKETDDHRTRVSLRSRDRINVAEIAGRFGGGGHLHASGFELPENLENARAKAIELLTECLS